MQWRGRGEARGACKGDSRGGARVTAGGAHLTAGGAPGAADTGLLRLLLRGVCVCEREREREKEI